MTFLPLAVNMTSSHTPETFQQGARFRGKVALCTASTAGIGLAVAERLAQEGAKVVLSSRRKENVDSAVEKLRSQNLEVSGIVCHQAKKEDRQKLIKFTLDTYGTIDVLFASAGVNPFHGDMLKVREAEWDKLFDVNVKSTFLMIRETVPFMNKNGGGAIVTNSTIAALYPSMGGVVLPYAIAKSTLTGLTKVLAPVLYRDKIRINTIAPGPINTKFLEGLLKHYNPEATSPPKMIENTCVMKRVADPRECASVVAFLLSDDSSFITGEVLPVTGGVLLSPASVL